MNTVRIYGKTVNTWKAYDEALGREVITQIEVAYDEYDYETAEKIGSGTEDFSSQRARDLKTYWVWTWDGKSYNQGARRKFEDHGSVRVYAPARGFLYRANSVLMRKHGAKDCRLDFCF